MISLAAHKLRYSGPKQFAIDSAICLRTLSRYPHVELLIECDGAKPLRFSATPELGARFEEWTEDPKNWSIIKLTLTEQQEAYARNLMNELVGSKYGWDDIRHYLAPWTKDDIDRYCCSNIIGCILSRDGYFQIPERACWKLSPANLRAIVADKETKRL